MSRREIEVAGNVCDSVTGRPLTGAWLWDSALILAQFMSTHLDFQNKSVLELGAGTGLPGLTAARLGATRVVLTDIKPLLPGLINNAEVNGLGDRVEVRELVRGSDENELSQLSELGEIDVVIMSDVFFDPEEMVGLGKTLKRVCGRDTMVWAVSEVRSWTGECLQELIMSQGFRVIEFTCPCQLSDGGSEEEEEGEDKNLEVFAVYQLTPLRAENCHMADICI